VTHIVTLKGLLAWDIKGKRPKWYLVKAVYNINNIRSQLLLFFFAPILMKKLFGGNY